jgi:hypothetical protein
MSTKGFTITIMSYDNTVKEHVAKRASLVKGMENRN